MIHKQRLKDIAIIYSGYAFREAVIDVSDGNMTVIQAKDIKTNEYITDTSTFVKVSLENRTHLQINDVLLVSRGAGNHRSAIFKTNEENVIASSTLYIIRIKNPNILPEYLSLYLNSLDGQSQLLQITTGAYIQNIAKNNLENIEIPIPLIMSQKGLVALQQNIMQQEKIQEKKIRLKKNIVNETIKNIIKRQV